MWRTVELVMGVLSITMFVGSLAAIPWLVRRLPPDYFVRPPPKHSFQMKIARNVGGVALIVAGVVMLLLPGQGIMTILVGLSVVDLPVKHRVVQWILERPKIR